MELGVELDVVVEDDEEEELDLVANELLEESLVL